METATRDDARTVWSTMWSQEGQEMGVETEGGLKGVETEVKGLRFGAPGLTEEVAVLDPRPGRFGRDRKKENKGGRFGAKCKSEGLA